MDIAVKKSYQPGRRSRARDVTELTWQLTRILISNASNVLGIGLCYLVILQALLFIVYWVGSWGLVMLLCFNGFPTPSFLAKPQRK